MALNEAISVWTEFEKPDFETNPKANKEASVNPTKAEGNENPRLVVGCLYEPKVENGENGKLDFPEELA